MFNSDAWKLKMPRLGFSGFDQPKAPKLAGMEPYPGLDLSGLKDWVSESLARQFMPGKLYPSQIASTAAQAYSPLLKMEAEYPFQKWGAGEEARRFGAGYSADIWGKQLMAGLDEWSQMLQAALAGKEMAQRERFAQRQFMSPMERMGGPYR